MMEDKSTHDRVEDVILFVRDTPAHQSECCFGSRYTL